MRLEPEIRLTGLFWLPSDIENKISGILTISNGGKIELELFDSFKDKSLDYHSMSERFRINGLVENSKFVTLDQCIYTHRNLVTRKAEIYAHFALIGVHLDDGEKATYNHLYFNVDSLSQWINMNGFTIEEGDSLLVKFTTPNPICFKLQNGMGLEFRFGYKGIKHPVVDNASITQDVAIKLTSDTGQNLDNFVKVAHRITHLLRLAIRKPVSIKEVSANLAGSSVTNLSNSRINIFYPSTTFSQKTYNVHPYDILFRYPIVKDELPSILNKWLDLYDEMPNIMELYFRLASEESTDIVGRFINFTKCLEGFHRTIDSSTKEWSEEEFTEIVASILEYCPQKHEDWLRERLKHANELSLRQRIKRMTKDFDCYWPDKKKFSDQITKLRNYYTHYDPKTDKPVVDSIELTRLIYRMDCLFTLHLLKKVGFSTELLMKIVDNSIDFKEKLMRRYQ